jgi:hypothetical protein
MIPEYGMKQEIYLFTELSRSESEGEEECEENKFSSSPFTAAWECEKKFFLFHQVPIYGNEVEEENEVLFDRLVFDSTNEVLFASK